MRGRTYNKMGSKDEAFGAIDAYSTVSIMGSGDVTIQSIGDNVVVTKMGSGDLSIKGAVGENVKFVIQGSGNVTFKVRPPESTINLIENSGTGDRSMPGGFPGADKASKKSGDSSIIMSGGGSISFRGGKMFTSGGRNQGRSVMNINGRSIISENGTVTVSEGGVTTKYRGNNAMLYNNQLMIDNTAVTDNDPRIINIDVVDSAPAARAPARAPRSPEMPRARAPEPAKHQKLASDEPRPQPAYSPPPVSRVIQEELNAETRSFAASLGRTTSNSERFNAVQLSPAAKEKYQRKNPDNFDPVTKNIINIPVTATSSGKIFNIGTLMDLPKDAMGNRQEPGSGLPFQLADIRPAQFADQLIKKDLTKLEKKAPAPSALGTFAHKEEASSNSQANNQSNKSEKKL